MQGKGKTERTTVEHIIEFQKRTDTNNATLAKEMHVSLNGLVQWKHKNDCPAWTLLAIEGLQRRIGGQVIPTKPDIWIVTTVNDTQREGLSAFLKITNIKSVKV